MKRISNAAIYIVKRHAEYGDYLAIVLSAGILATTEEVRPFVETLKELHHAVKERYGEQATLVGQREFQVALERRKVHSPEMLALLETNSEGDLRAYYVYGSPSRPMSAVWVRNLPGALFLPTDWQRTRYYTYVVTPVLLDETSVLHYNLVFLSGPVTLAMRQANQESEIDGDML